MVPRIVAGTLLLVTFVLGMSGILASLTGGNFKSAFKETVVTFCYVIACGAVIAGMLYLTSVFAIGSWGLK